MEKRRLPKKENQRPDSANHTDFFPDSLPRRPAPIVPTAGTVKHDALLALFSGPVSQPTRAAVAAVRAGGQAGFVRPDLVGLVAVAAPAIVVLLAAFFGGA